MRKMHKMSTTTLAFTGVVLIGLAYLFMSSTAALQSSSLLAAVTRTATNPLKVVSPNGGEVWAKDSTQKILWTGGGSNWKLEVLLKNSSTTNTVVTIASSTSNTGAIAWKVPTTLRSRSYNIRIRCTNCPKGTKGVTDISDSPFSITSVVGAPDLVAGMVSPTATIAGTATALSSLVTNIGNASTGSGFGVVFQLASSSLGANAVTIANPATTALAGGSSRTVSSSYTFPTAGTYYVRACADMGSTGLSFGGSTYAISGGVINESNENNNCGAYTAITVTTTSKTSLNVEFVSANTTANVSDGANDDQGTFQIRYKITAINGDVYIPTKADVVSASSTMIGKTVVTIDRNGTLAQTTGTVSTLENITDSTVTPAGNYLIRAGTTETFVVTTSVQLPAVGSAGQYRMMIGGIWWGSSDSTLLNNSYSGDLSAFKTNYLYLN